jgi:hypothetical protein
MQGLAGKYDIPDEQVRDYTFGFKRGGQLCLGTVLENGTIQHEVLLEKPAGAICYPTLSWDARTLVFSMRENFESDSYYLYALDMAHAAITARQNGRSLPVADCELVACRTAVVFTSA